MDLLPQIWPYGTLFVVAFAAATILPAQSEALLAGLIAADRYDLLLLLLVATIGNTLGSMVNWGLGRWIESFRGRRWFPVTEARLEQAERWYQKWGLWSLLLSWAPIVGDALTLAAGMLRANFLAFTALVLIAKGGRYLVVALVVIKAA